MQYFPLFYSTAIVLDQCPNKNKLIQGSLTTYSNFYRAISASFFSFFNLKIITWRFKNKKMREGVKRGGRAIPMNIFLGE